MNRELLKFDLFGIDQIISDNEPTGFVRFMFKDDPLSQSTFVTVSYKGEINYNDGPFGKLESVTFFIDINGFAVRSAYRVGIFDFYKKLIKDGQNYREREILCSMFSAQVVETILTVNKEFF